GGGLQVDVVYSGSGPADHLQPGPCGDGGFVDPGLAAHDQRVVVGDAAAQLALRLAEQDVDLDAAAQTRDPRFRDWIRDQDARHRGVRYRGTAASGASSARRAAESAAPSLTSRPCSLSPASSAVTAAVTSSS